MMKCPHCGSFIDDDTDFCDNCGSFITKETSETKVEQEIPIEKRIFVPDLFSFPEEPEPKKKKSFVSMGRQGNIIIISICIIIAAALLFKIVSQAGRRRAVAGIGEPVQEETAKYFEKEIGGYDVSIYAIYTYEIEALVVHTKNYPGTNLAGKLAPKDVALAWGRVAEYNKKVNFHWRQSGRFCYWRIGEDAEIVGGIEYIEQHASNNHLIPADKSVKRKIKKIKKGDHIKIKGYLVNVDAENNKGETFFWDSSTTRDDTGDGACEIIYVTDVIWLD